MSGGFTADTALTQDNPKATTIYRLCVLQKMMMKKRQVQ